MLNDHTKLYFDLERYLEEFLFSGGPLNMADICCQWPHYIVWVFKRCEIDSRNVCILYFAVYLGTYFSTARVKFEIGCLHLSAELILDLCFSFPC